MVDSAVLDDPVGESLRGPHRHLARRHGSAMTYLPDVATFLAVPAEPTPADWQDVSTLLGSGGFADLFSSPAMPPGDWPHVFTLPGLQMLATDDGAVPSDADGGITELTAADVPEMRDLVRRTRPGPFWARTIEMGTYLGIRRDGRLAAMAGERLKPPGWTEISAVCTAPEERGRGLAARLVREVSARIRARGESPFIHVAVENVAAVALYEQLGFRTRQAVTFHGYTVP